MWKLRDRFIKLPASEVTTSMFGNGNKEIGVYENVYY